MDEDGYTPPQQDTDTDGLSTSVNISLFHYTCVKIEILP